MEMGQMHVCKPLFKQQSADNLEFVLMHYSNDLSTIAQFLSQSVLPQKLEGSIFDKLHITRFSLIIFWS